MELKEEEKKYVLINDGVSNLIGKDLMERIIEKIKNDNGVIKEIEV